MWCVEICHAFVHRVHCVVGMRSGVCGDSTHGLPGASRSHRLSPITIAPAPPRIEYGSGSGDSRRQWAVTECVSSEARCSMYSTLRDVRIVRVMLATPAAAGVAL